MKLRITGTINRKPVDIELDFIGDTNRHFMPICVTKGKHNGLTIFEIIQRAKRNNLTVEQTP